MFPDQPLRATTWAKGEIRDLGDFGWIPNGGEAINDRGQITGYMSVPTGFRNRVAFIYTHGRLDDIDGRPATTEDRSSAGSGINNYGHVVGASNQLSGFIYRGKRMQSLNALIDPASGWDIRDPRAINDTGQIAAAAYRKGVAGALNHFFFHQFRCPLGMQAIYTRVVVAGGWLGAHKRSQASAATANRHPALIRAILRRACDEWKWIEKAPKFQLYREAKRRVRWITPDQAKALLTELPEHDGGVRAGDRASTGQRDGPVLAAGRSCTQDGLSAWRRRQERRRPAHLAERPGRQCPAAPAWQTRRPSLYLQGKAHPLG